MTVESFTVPASFHYLAGPYSHKDPEVRALREQALTLIAAYLMKTYEAAIFSPITHGVQVAKHLPEELLLGHTFWMRQCLPLVSKASSLLIAMLPGVEESRRVAAELALAKAAGVEIFPLTEQNLQEILPPDLYLRLFHDHSSTQH